MIDGATRYAGTRHGKPQQFTKTPIKWLEGAHWQDEPEPEERGNGSWREERSAVALTARRYGLIP